MNSKPSVPEVESGRKICKCGHTVMLHNTFLGVCSVCYCEGYEPAASLPEPREEGARTEDELLRKWHVGSMNDALFVIDAPPRPSAEIRSQSTAPDTAALPEGIEDLLLTSETRLGGDFMPYEVYRADINSRIREARSRKTKWVSVEERLPDLDVEVLVSFVNPTAKIPATPCVSTAAWCTDFTNEPHWADPADTRKAYDHLLITRWADMPSPYREK